MPETGCQHNASLTGTDDEDSRLGLVEFPLLSTLLIPSLASTYSSRKLGLPNVGDQSLALLEPDEVRCGGEERPRLPHTVHLHKADDAEPCTSSVLNLKAASKTDRFGYSTAATSMSWSMLKLLGV